jgi:undecaprenol kinase
MMNLHQFGSSLKHALRGVRVVLEQEQSFRIQVLLSFAAIALAWVYPLSGFERTVVLLLIGSVLTLEMINSVFERIVDTFKPRIHPVVKDIKDIMAGTVFIASLIALCVGLLIFGPHLFRTYAFLVFYE